MFKITGITYLGFCFFVTTLWLLPTLTEAKIFNNAYISFDMPDRWNCVLEHTEWVCRSTSEQEAKEAIIVLTAKEVGPTDSYEAYTQHLNTPQIINFSGRPYTSRIANAPKQSKINDQIWIDGLHLGSEVPNYFTRYLATIKDRIAILVTLSAHKDHYTKYANDFLKTVASLKVIATSNLLKDMNPGGNQGGTMGSAPIWDNVPMPGDMMEDEDAVAAAAAREKSKKTKQMMMGLGIILLAIGVYIYLKSKAKK